MNIIGREYKKIMTPGRLAVIFAFTLLYYSTYIYVTRYPYIRNWGYYTEYYTAELVEELEPSLGAEDLHLLAEKREKLVAEADTLIPENLVLAAAGIHNYEEMMAFYSSYDPLGTPSDIERNARTEIQSYEFGNQHNELERVFILLKNIDRLNKPYNLFALSEEDAGPAVEKYWGDFATPLYKKAKTQFAQRDLSLLPYLVESLLWHDMYQMVILLVICTLILLVPYQIHEKLCGVMPLYATTRTGRHIYRKQAAAELLACGSLCAVQLLVYLGIHISKGLALYWKCPAWATTYNEFWLPITFGAYLAVYMLMVTLFTLGAAASAYLIGRCSGNYIAGIALSIPIGGLTCYLGRRLFNSLFAFSQWVRVPLWEPPVLALWLALTGGLLVFVLRISRKKDL